MFQTLLVLLVFLTASRFGLAAPSLTLVSRDVSLTENKIWEIRYLLRTEGMPLPIDPNSVSADIEGYVSNSAVPGMGHPKKYSAFLSSQNSRRTETIVVYSADSDVEGKELAEMTVTAIKNPNPSEPDLTEVQIKLQHLRFLYGPNEPLYGPRTITLKVNGEKLSDSVALNYRPHRLRPVRFAAPPADRLDPRIYFSAPDSLHLESHVPGNQFYRFDFKVRYSTKMRLRFRYLVAPGTEGEGYAWLRQYRDASVWTVLPDHELKIKFPQIGHWTSVDEFFFTAPEATDASLEFRISGAGDVGEIWIDDFSLEPWPVSEESKP